MKRIPVLSVLAFLLLPSFLTGCRTSSTQPSTDAGGTLAVSTLLPGLQAVIDRATPTDVVFVDGAALTGFDAPEAEPWESIEDVFGTGERMQSRSTSKVPGGGQLDRMMVFSRYDAYPGVLFMRTDYRNSGTTPLQVDSIYAQQYRLLSPVPPGGDAAPFWSFQGSSYSERPDWVFPVRTPYARYNYQGMNASDYGGGVPVVDLWTPEGGVAIGHLEVEPQLIALPVEMVDDRRVTMRLVNAEGRRLAPGETFEGLPTFVMHHDGDFFGALTTYAALMADQGLEMPPYPETTYEPIWCAWGYGRNFDTEAVLGTIPKVKELGLEWVVLDDGWQTAEGDWFLHPDRFPRGDADMKALVDTIHAEGLKAKLWWVPFGADPGTELEKEHPDWFILNEDGERQLITWWDAYYLCPAVPEVRAHTESLIRRFIEEWGFDGLKIDGQNLNAVPPCYNPAHNHAQPTESVEAVPDYFEAIYEQATDAKPYAVVELCPCGTAASFFNMPHNNQPVSSDPLSSWQIRTKGKTFKALMGPSVPYYGDHVELSDGGTDFASTVGIGGVVGTKFTWAPEERRADAGWLTEEEPRSHLLTEERDAHWQKWIGLYKELDLAKGTYLGNLYDVGYDRPEAHAVEKGDRRYFAFYADAWDGPVELRGLGAARYQVRDYVNERSLGTVEGPQARLDVAFQDHLLLEATPIR